MQLLVQDKSRGARLHKLNGAWREISCPIEVAFHGCDMADLPCRARPRGDNLPHSDPMGAANGPGDKNLGKFGRNFALTLLRVGKERHP